nr:MULTISPECIES: transposase [Brasilonema]
MQNHKLGQSIADSGFYEFKRQLEYKCKKFGSKLVLADRWYPSSKTCSRCGCKKESLLLSERVYNCEHCGHVIDRDLNAAINLSHCSTRVFRLVSAKRTPRALDVRRAVGIRTASGQELACGVSRLAKT